MNNKISLSKKVAGVLIIFYICIVIIFALTNEIQFIVKYGFAKVFGNLTAKNIWTHLTTVMNLILYLILLRFSFKMLRNDNKARSNIVKLSLLMIFIFFPLCVILSYIIVGPNSIMMIVPLVPVYIFFLIILLLLVKKNNQQDNETTNKRTQQ